MEWTILCEMAYRENVFVCSLGMLQEMWKWCRGKTVLCEVPYLESVDADPLCMSQGTEKLSKVIAGWRRPRRSFVAVRAVGIVESPMGYD